MNFNVFFAWVLGALIGVGLWTSQVFAVAMPGGHQLMSSPPVSRLIVKFTGTGQRNPSMSAGERAAYIAQQQTGLDMRYARTLSDGAMLLDLPYPMSHAEALIYARNLAGSEAVIYAEPDAWRWPLLQADDAFYSSLQWNLQDTSTDAAAANLPAAWDITTGNKAIVVAVVDTGALNHIDLDSRFVGGSAAASGRDFISDVVVANDGNGRDSNPTDPGDASDGTFCQFGTSSWHGTHVAGTIGAESNNAQGIAGVDWDARLLTLRALGVCGGPSSDINEAVRWAAGETIDGVPNPNPAHVINLSLGGGGECLASEQAAIDAAVAAGAVVVVAAGNEGADVANAAPANCNNVIVVTALEKNGARASFGNFGEEVDIAAPGVQILSTLDSGPFSARNDNAYVNYQGTSMAAPHVSGVVALMLASNPNLTNGSISNVPGLIEAKLKASARSFPTGTINDCHTNTCGAGILDAYQAVLAVSTAPSIDNMLNQAVGSGQTVSLNASAMDDVYSGGISYQWRQVSGTSVALQNSNTASASFVAPNVSEILVFEIVVSDDTGMQSADNVSVSVSSVAGSDPVPDQFIFTDQTNVPLSSSIDSNSIVVSGINVLSPVSVTDGEYRVNGGAYTTANGFVSNGDSVNVRHTSSSTASGIVQTTLNIAGVSDVFSSQTISPDDPGTDGSSSSSTSSSGGGGGGSMGLVSLIALGWLLLIAVIYRHKQKHRLDLFHWG